MLLQIIIIFISVAFNVNEVQCTYNDQQHKHHRVTRQDFFFPDQVGHYNFNQRPQNNFPMRPKPAKPATRPTPASRPSQQTRPTPPPFVNRPNPARPGTIQSNRIEERISQAKCKEYAKLNEKTFQTSQLSLSFFVQDHSGQECDIYTGLIVGGVKALVKEFPHMAAIGYRGEFNELTFGCGGSLISEKFVLTAAHCRTRAFSRAQAAVVRLGAINLDTPQSDDYAIQGFIPHPYYNSVSKQNDIALVKLAKDVSFSNPELIRPACLWSKAKLDYTTTVATGWGRTEYASQASQDLMKVELDIIDNSICQITYDDREEIVINNNQICSGVLKGGQDTCQGDSGGPIQIVMPDNKCVSYVIGVTSFGGFCGGKNSPSIYTRVSAYIDWIELIVWDQ